MATVTVHNYCSLACRAMVHGGAYMISCLEHRNDDDRNSVLSYLIKLALKKKATSSNQERYRHHFGIAVAFRIKRFLVF